jgi:FAD/FMN-containing dehydrogenase
MIRTSPHAYGRAMVNETAVSQLRAQIRGSVVEPWDADYAEARKVYNALHDKWPALVVRVADALDVATAVRFAREQDLLLAVRGGAHSVAGFSTCDGGLVLDLSRLRGIQVDPQRLTVRAQGGCTWAELNQATYQFGMATTGGVVSTTGIAGLTLGGGLGFLNRSCGLSCDNLLSADVVTAGGEVLSCDEERNPDLFWAIRGGGGNFGVVTSFEYRLHPVADILGGPTFFPLDGDVLRGYRDLMAKAPEELGALLAIAFAPPAPFRPSEWHGRTVAVVLTCWTGPVDEGRRLLETFDTWGPVLGRAVDVIPYPVINTLFDADLPAGLYHYWKSHFVRGLPDGAIDVHLEYGATLPAAETGTILFPMDGACRRVPAQDTAFAYRDVDFGVALGPSWREAAATEANIEWGRRYSAALAPYCEPGGYVNLGTDEGQHWVGDSYGPNYARLAQVKRAYDPGNLFRLNQNIPPASTT